MDHEEFCYKFSNYFLDQLVDAFVKEFPDEKGVTGQLLADTLSLILFKLVRMIEEEQGKKESLSFIFEAIKASMIYLKLSEEEKKSMFEPVHH